MGITALLAATILDSLLPNNAYYVYLSTHGSQKWIRWKTAPSRKSDYRFGFLATFIHKILQDVQNQFSFSIGIILIREIPNFSASSFVLSEL